MPGERRGTLTEEAATPAVYRAPSAYTDMSRAQLLALALSRGLDVDGRWGAARLRAALVEAESG